ncbi:LLM class flavin-dependent oxidoreductase [Nocardiopsis alba]|uniref:LLM class flavin-dependent oxidoreductase n=1 Tax=Nocardiopsis alba TaxID=53437 RepID=UPI003F4D4BD5
MKETALPVPLSLVDPLPIFAGATLAESVESGIELARDAERLGYRRLWYTEHHNQGCYAGSATSVLIAHAACRTDRIRLGAGGVMLPNHSPLVVAEHFGTLATLHPDRIDLGVGRGVGGPAHTSRALRRSTDRTDSYEEDLAELRGHLWDSPDDHGEESVRAFPGTGTRVPLYLLGSSVAAARTAASSGLPFCFASHFTPDPLEEASRVYRSEFRPSPQCAEPWFIAGVNVTAAETGAQAQEEVWAARRRLSPALSSGRSNAEETRAAFDSPLGRRFLQRYTYSAIGAAEETARYLRWFAEHAGADELMIEFHTGSARAREVALRLVADAMLTG